MPNQEQVLAWDAENRLSAVTYTNRTATGSGGGSLPTTCNGVPRKRVFLPLVVYQPPTERYSYDADGARVRKETKTEITRYIGPHFEVTVAITNSQVLTTTKYYDFGGQRIAVRQVVGANQTLSYLHGDHLASTSVSTNNTGAKTNDVRYYAYGGQRSGNVLNLPTDYAFTGQKLDRGTGLMYYGARNYDSALEMFVSPDPLVPSPGDPLSLNRYAYVRNSPLQFTDSTGYSSEDELLNKYKVCIGPNQLRSTRDTPETAYWYYLLRAAEIGDTVRFGGERGDVTGQIIVEDEKLWVAGNNGIKYGVGWEGLGGIGSGISRQGVRLTKAEGTTFNTEEQLRRYTNGPHSLLEADYVEATFGGYWGVGGHVSVKRDRYGTWHLGLNGGAGIGKLGWSVEDGAPCKRVFLPLVMYQPPAERYSYDADGGRVRKETKTEVTRYIGPHYAETVVITNGQMLMTTKYFYGSFC